MITSHPRPDFRRSDDRWTLLDETGLDGTGLDGTWQLALDETEDWQPVQVPAPWESAASGIGTCWVERARYRRSLELPPVGPDETLILHFQAVHHRARVLVDGILLADHTGGQLPFEVELSHLVRQTVELTVEVEAPADKAEIPHGKQRSIPADPYDVCSFTPCSGIWQSVWLERRPRTYLRSVRFVSREDLDGFTVSADVVGEADAVRVNVVGGRETVEFCPTEPADLLLAHPRVWRPADPQLYELTVDVLRAGLVLDTVTCTTGLRTIRVDGPELRLNGERIHLRGVLDQGYWPASGWTAPSLDALEADLRAARDAGFTLVRKHLKLEDPRWLAAADRLGLLVWEEPPCVSVFTDTAVTAFEAQLAPMIERDANHPSIIVWGIYNEEWGLDWDVAGDPAKAETLSRAYKQVVALDPTRPVIDNSGWSHVQTDLVDWHVYSPDQPTWLATLDRLDAGFDVELGPGGVQHKNLYADGRSVDGVALLNSEYGTGRTSVERAWVMRWQTQELRRDEASNGYVYCELYDIEHEIAGVLTFDRKPKDDLGLACGDTHADVVIVLDVTPAAPGVDLVTADGSFELTTRVSSHLPEPETFRLLTGWGPSLGRDPGPGVDPRRVAVLSVTPYRLSEPLQLGDRLPAGRDTARLHLWLVPESATDVIAHTVLDVRLDAAAPSLPPSSLH